MELCTPYLTRWNSLETAGEAMPVRLRQKLDQDLHKMKLQCDDEETYRHR
jgi:hypothetical protein